MRGCPVRSVQLDPVSVLGDRRLRWRLVRIARSYNSLVDGVARRMAVSRPTKPPDSISRAAWSLGDIRPALEQYTSPYDVRRVVDVLLKLLHLAYLATGKKGVRDAAILLYGLSLIDELDEQGVRDALEAIRALLQGDARRAHGLVARLAGGRLPRPPRDALDEWAAVLEANYILDVASEVDGALLDAWGFTLDDTREAGRIDESV